MEGKTKKGQLPHSELTDIKRLEFTKDIFRIEMGRNGGTH